MVIDKDIELMENYIERQKQEQDRARGVHRRKATPQETNRMLGGDD